jgi:CHASE2 domain-containing sensor protein
MTARHKKESSAPPAADSGVTQAVIVTKRHEVLRKIRFSFWMSLVITISLLLVKLRVERTNIGGQIESMTYDLLQNHLTASGDLRVVVLNISGIQMKPTLGPQPGLITDREPLKDIVDALVKLKKEGQGPTAIGLDVDFSPDVHGYAYPDDPKVLDFLLDMNKEIPIRVGVNSSLALGPQRWLGDPKYMDLATCVTVPKPEKGQSTWYMPEFLVVNYPAASFGGISERCPSMGVALANATVKEVSPELSLFAETIRMKTGEDPISKSEFLVDYSPLESLIRSAPDVVSAADLAKEPAKESVKGKIVLLGRTKNTTDTFTVPGKPEQAYPGVFLHACAIYTLKNGPLYGLKGLTRTLFDVGFSAIVFGSLFLIRSWQFNQGMEVAIGHRLPAFLSLGVAFILSIGATYFVDKTHVMWDDFILVDIVLLVHTPIEHNTVEFGKWLGATMRSWFRISPPSTGPRSAGK